MPLFPTPPLVSPKFPHIPLGVDGSPLATKSEGVGLIFLCVAWWCSGRASDSWSIGCDRFPAVPLLGATLGKLFTHVCLCSPSSINWYRLRLGVKCTTGAVLLGMLAAIRRTLRLAANRGHSSIVLTCGCRCTAALKWLNCHLRRYINCRYFFSFLSVQLRSKISNICDHTPLDPTSQISRQTDGRHAIARLRFALKCIAR